MDVRIGETDVGRGLFVTRDFATGERILCFHGTEISFSATLAKGEREGDAFQIGPDRYLDLLPPEVFLNHSCAPNAGIRNDLELVALRDVRAGEEIRFDYSTTMDEDHWEMACRCGAACCRGLIRDYKWLPRDWKLQLIRQNAVPGFIIASEVSAGRLAAEMLIGAMASTTVQTIDRDTMSARKINARR